MGAFDYGNETIEIHSPAWDANEMVVARTTPTLEDEEWVNNQVLKLKQADEKDGEAGLNIDSHLGATRRLWIERMLVSWTLTKDGLPVPLTPKAIKLLPTVYADYIYDKINKAQPKLSKKDETDFLASAKERSKES
jgi:hypothetical protein